MEQRSRRGDVLIAASAIGFGVGTALSVAALTAFNQGIGHVTASRAGVLFSLQPVAGALTGIVVLGEPLGAGQAVGGALIVLGVLVISGRPTPEERLPPRIRRAKVLAERVRPCVGCP